MSFLSIISLPDIYALCKYLCIKDMENKYSKNNNE